MKLNLDSIPNWKEDKNSSVIQIRNPGETPRSINKKLGKRMEKHGLRYKYVSTYSAWTGLRYRCYCESCDCFNHYGGRGIGVCRRWMVSFAAFFKDMGPCPVGYSIERINNDGHYSPDNCKWATRNEQIRNTRACKPITFKGETLLASEWASRIGICTRSMRMRISNGWTSYKAVTTPPLKRVSK